MLNDAMRAWVRKRYGLAASFNDDAFFKEKLAESLTNGDLTADELRKLNGEKTMPKTTSGPTADDVLGGGKSGGNVRVIGAGERYGTTKAIGKHVKTGKPVRNERGQEVTLASELELAKIGSWLKYRAARDGCSVQLTEHERALVGDIFEHDTFCGPLNGEYRADVPGSRVRSLISDVASGGGELNPIFFDDAIVTFPLLHGELLPQVTIVPVPRGSSVEGASIGNPSVAWGTGDGTSINVFDTAALAAAIDTSIHPVTVAVEFGNDLAQDSPANVGAILLGNIGEKMMAELDRVIVLGDGSSEPEGIFNASGITTNAWGGDAATVSDYEGLLFGIGKQYRNAGFRPAFFSNDTSYRRSRGIAVGASDQRRVFGMDHGSYQLLEHPYKISNNLANTQVGFGALAKYRMYRRQAVEARFERGGKELALKNLTLLVVRGRWGGKVVDPNAFVVTTTAEA